MSLEDWEEAHGARIESSSSSAPGGPAGSTTGIHDE
jgi:hypothetical protein